MQLKKITFGILLFAIFINTATAQRGYNNRIKTYKTAYITEALELTVKEAESFWPIYNAYEEEYRNIKVVKTRQLHKKIRDAGGVDNLSKSEAEAILNEFLEIDIKAAEVKEKLKKDLSGIISSKKMIKLFSAEQNFNKELLQRFRNRAGNPNKN
ncbi:hypothetical protein EGM88_01200 [Aureibaculum marinum]|uniref:Sensor of ECF-type sigma factor n=1 Tax=Aureibaculum marinum TaxID=2487930 RepID=A0A3N4NU63_9FLAO|nr:hypothetical protein [Aureibaculum marinum]RPD99911.1 hypothetical protein EGM88_01200 [Aureibaculum marinum]